MITTYEIEITRENSKQTLIASEEKLHEIFNKLYREKTVKKIFHKQIKPNL
jgi:hypothetical protein